MQDGLQQYVVESLRNIIKAKNLTQQDLAEKMELSRQMISNYLTGRTEITLDIFDRFCLSLEVSLIKILDNFEQQEEPEHIVNEIQADYKLIENINLVKLKKDLERSNEIINYQHSKIEDKEEIIRSKTETINIQNALISELNFRLENNDNLNKRTG